MKIRIESSIDEARILIGTAQKILFALSDPDVWEDGDLDHDSSVELSRCAAALREVNKRLAPFAPDMDQLVE